MNSEPTSTGEILNLDACDDDVDVAQLKELLPGWKTHILEAKNIDKENFPKLSLTFLLDAHSVEDIKQWLTQLQENNKTTYSIYSTAKSTGKYVYFKQRLVCQHNTKSKNVYDPSTKTSTGTKNTNCPSKMTVVLHAIKKRCKRKNVEKVALLREMPCEVTFIATHNHPTSTPDTLRFRKISNEVKEKLLKLFHDGHSPSSALELIKADLTLNNENHEELLADRKYCPTYQDCYHLYRKEFGEKLVIKSRNSRKRKIEMVNEIDPKVEVEVEPLVYQIEISKKEVFDSDDDVADVETIKDKARAVLARINAEFLNFVDIAPMEMVTGLEALEKTLKKIDSPSDCVAHCLSFGSDVEKKYPENHIDFQSTNIKYRKSRTIHIQGHPRSSNNRIETTRNVIRKNNNVEVIK